MNERERLRHLANGMAAINPDAAEILAEALCQAARQAKAPPGLGVTVRINLLAGQVELRGPGAEIVLPLDEEPPAA